jgi:hypothetical protein
LGFVGSLYDQPFVWQRAQLTSNSSSPGWRSRSRLERERTLYGLSPLDLDAMRGEPCGSPHPGFAPLARLSARSSPQPRLILQLLTFAALRPRLGRRELDALGYATMSLIAWSFFGPPPSMPQAGIGVPGRPNVMIWVTCCSVRRSSVPCWRRPHPCSR